MSALDSSPAVVVGARRGLGKGIALALAAAGVPVVAVSRRAAAYPRDLAVQPVTADAADPGVPPRLLHEHDPGAVVVVAGAVPSMRPIHEHSWESFSAHWEADVRIAFEWVRTALLAPLQPGGRVVVVSSAAAVQPSGSPLSGGYAGAKATQRHLVRYAQEESDRAGLGITFTTLLPQLAPTTAVGEAAVGAYAARAGTSVKDFVRQRAPHVTPELAGAAVLELLLADATTLAREHLLTGRGLQAL